MPTKASITTRTGKGSPLTTAEMDNNLTNLRDQSIAIADDTSTTFDVESGNTITIAGSGTVSTASSGQTLTITGSGITATSTDTLQNKTINTANNTITIAEADISDLGSYITASSTDTLTNKTFDVEGTGNSISNIDVADLKSGVLDTDLASVSASDDTLASAKAIKAYVDGQASGINNLVEDSTPQLGGQLDVNGNAIGDGSLELLKFSETASAVNELTITNAATGGNPKFSATGDDTNITLDLAPKGTGHIEILGATNAGTIQLNCEANTHGQKLRSQPHSEAITNTMLMPKGADSTLVSEIAAQTLTQKTFEDYKETIYTSGSTTGTITPDVANGNVQSITLTGSITFNAFANAETGQSMTLIVKQSATGGETLTSTMKFAGGAKTLSTAANAIDIITVLYDGTNYYANLVTNFS